MHKPPFDRRDAPRYAAMLDEAFARQLKRDFQQASVDAVFTGHVHAAHLWVEDGIPYVVSGEGFETPRGASENNCVARVRLRGRLLGGRVHPDLARRPVVNGPPVNRGLPHPRPLPIGSPGRLGPPALGRPALAWPPGAGAPTAAQRREAGGELPLGADIDDVRAMIALGAERVIPSRGAPARAGRPGERPARGLARLTSAASPRRGAALAAGPSAGVSSRRGCGAGDGPWP